MSQQGSDSLRSLSVRDAHLEAHAQQAVMHDALLEAKLIGRAFGLEEDGAFVFEEQQVREPHRQLSRRVAPIAADVGALVVVADRDRARRAETPRTAAVGTANRAGLATRSVVARLSDPALEATRGLDTSVFEELPAGTTIARVRGARVSAQLTADRVTAQRSPGAAGALAQLLWCRRWHRPRACLCHAALLGVEARVGSTVAYRPSNQAIAGTASIASIVTALLRPPHPGAAGRATQSGFATGVRGFAGCAIDRTAVTVGSFARSAFDRKAAVAIPVPTGRLVADGIRAQQGFSAMRVASGRGSGVWAPGGRNGSVGDRRLGSCILPGVPLLTAVMLVTTRTHQCHHEPEPRHPIGGTQIRCP